MVINRLAVYWGYLDEGVCGNTPQLTCTAILFLQSTSPTSCHLMNSGLSATQQAANTGWKQTIINHLLSAAKEECDMSSIPHKLGS